MSERYSRRDAENAFQRLLTATGNREAKSYADVGGWQLDYAACYGGFVVNEISNEAGGAGNPLGIRRRNAREFCSAVDFAIRAIEAAK